jgi:tyrosine-protein kinase Etk/Wzc
MLQQWPAKLWLERRALLVFALGALVLGFAVAFLLPSQYASTSRIIPPQQQQSVLGSILSQLGAAGLVGLGGPRNTAELYVHLLRSDTVSLALSQRFNLEQHYGVSRFEDVHTKLEGRTQIRTGRDGVIVIRVTDADAAVAASLANGYVEELQKLVHRLTLDEASQRKRFLEERLAEVRKSLERAELAFRTLQETTGAIKIDGQVEGTFAAMGSLRANIAMKEVALRGLGTSMTRQNPTYQMMHAELAELKAQLQKLEQTPQAQNPQFVISAQQAPRLGMEYVRRLRDVKYEEAMYQVVLRQYELARMEETKDFVHVQVVDVARAATKRSFPPRRLIILLTALMVMSFAIYSILADRAWHRLDFWRRARP